MSKIELRMTNWLEKNIIVIMAVWISLIAVIIRLKGLTFSTDDAKYFLIPWFNQIKNMGGFSALRYQVGDYNIPYQMLIAIGTYLPLRPMVFIKLVSIIFDFALAFSIGLLYSQLKNRSVKMNDLLIGYSIAIILPTVILNSSYWGQCDSIYSTFVVLAIYFILKHKTFASFLFLGLAFTFKLQFIFILPLFIYLYIRQKNFSIFYFLIIPLVMYLVCIPALLMGRSITDPIAVYFSQSSTYNKMNMNAVNIWNLIGNQDYVHLKAFAILFTICVLSFAMFYIIYHRVSFSEDEVLAWGIWSVWTCVMFLPSMHERYAYLVDILLIVFALLNRKYCFVSIGAVLVSCIAYGRYMFESGKSTVVFSGVHNLKAILDIASDNLILAGGYFVLYILFTYLVFTKYKD